MLEHTLFNLAVRSANLICQQALPHSLWHSNDFPSGMPLELSLQPRTVYIQASKENSKLSLKVDFVTRTWIAFSFLRSFQCFIVSHGLIPPRFICWVALLNGKCQGIMCLRRLWMFPGVDDRLQHKSQGLCDCEAKGSDCRALPKTRCESQKRSVKPSPSWPCQPYASLLCSTVSE